MASRLSLHQKLLDILGTGKKAYFQPPESIKLTYPCIMYNLSNVDTKYANNKVYNTKRQYTLYYLDTNPDHTMVETLLNAFAMISYDRRYISNNIYHDVFTLYF